MAILAEAILAAIAVPAQAETKADEGIVFFEQKIRPVLVKHCYGCHSAQARDAKKLKGGLYLDSAEGLLTGGDGGPAIVKAKSAESLLIKALRYEGPEMPPGGKLADEVISDFVKWIDMGAPDPRRGGVVARALRTINIAEGRKWWSFQPLLTVTPPTVPDGQSVKSPIDCFVIDAQEKKRLTRNVPASREKLIRRAYFDLVGLPPTPEQIEEFVKDESPQAFEKVIDRLLESPNYGEKWARHWLDVARFAESGGYEFDAFRPGAYHYRDWVLRALNSDMAYDQFVRMQLAGDVRQPDDFLAAAATGFLVAGPYPGQITAKTIERIRYDQLDDMLMTVGGSMLGLTLGCVRCHDHKYDPSPQQDYYALAAAFARTVQSPRQLDSDPAATQQALERHRQERESLVDALRKFADKELPKRFEAWSAAELPKQPESPHWQVLEPVALEAERSWLKWLPGGIVAHDGSLIPGTKISRRGKPRTVGNEEQYHVTVHTFQNNITALRMDAFTDKSLPRRGPGLNSDGGFQLAELRVTARPLDPNTWDLPQELNLKPVFAAFEDVGQPLSNAVDNQPTTAWVVRSTAGKDNAAVFELETPLPGFRGGTELAFELKFLDLAPGRIRFSLTTEPNPATWAGDIAPQNLGEIRAILQANENKLPESMRASMVRWFSLFEAETAKVFQPLRDQAATEPRPALTEVYSTAAGGQDVFLLRRGEVDNKQGKAEPGIIQVLWRGDDSAAPTNPQPGASPADSRAALAAWITDVEHGAGPLLARVMVNRLWQRHFGHGIVRTPNDFGAQGERPTHPELLEWLAAQLVRGGWKLKPLHKQILLSAVYQQSNEVSEENLKIDPDNRYLWHYKPRRLDAEIIRDSLLAVGGNSDTSMFGPSVLEDKPRRSIYLRVKRSELIPWLTLFDAPEPTQSFGERISTTVPTQSLAFMNSPFVRQQAERLAQRICPTKDVAPGTALNRAYQIALGRLPSESEHSHMLEFFHQQSKVAGGDASVVSAQALAELCHAVLCLNEFVYVD